MVVYGSCWYPAYPPYYWPPPPVYGFGSPVVAGIGFGIGVGITSALWGGFDWGHHDVDINVNHYNNINVNNQLNVNKNVNVNNNVNKNVNDWYTPSFHGIDDTANQVVFRAAIPFALGGTQQILPRHSALRHLFALGCDRARRHHGVRPDVFNQPWGRWGVGISGMLPTGENGLSLDKWTAGPAAGFVNSSSKELNWGLFAQTFFSFAGDGGAPSVGLINLQPILSYQLGGGRSLSLGNSALVYDMESSRWTSLLLSVNYGQVVSFLGYKWPSRSATTSRTHSAISNGSSGRASRCWCRSKPGLDLRGPCLGGRKRVCGKSSMAPGCFRNRSR